MDLSRLFLKYESALNALAVNQRLGVEKYRHGMAKWTFSKMHPKGGTIRIDVQINEKGHVFLQKWWLFEWFFGGRMLSRHDERKRVNGSVYSVVSAIELAFHEVSNWPLGKWYK